MSQRGRKPNNVRAVTAILAFSEHAACRGVDTRTFYPGREGEVGGWNKDDAEMVAKAKAMCERCAVKVPCLNYAMAYEEMFGVWGGLTSRERNRLRKTWVPLALPADEDLVVEAEPGE